MTEELRVKEQMAIEFLRAMERPEGYHLSFSGGKDSCVIKHLADKAGVKYRAVYRITSVDPPELVQFIKREHPDVVREYPRDKDGNVVTMWSLIVKKGMMPTRLARYCCAELKEDSGDGMMAITGVRWAESNNRKNNHGTITIADKRAGKEFGEDDNFRVTRKGGVVLVNDNEESRRQIESCYKRRKTMVNPIVDWTDSEVWDYIHSEGIKYCSLYDEGFTRLGCIGCPMARKGRLQEFARFPTYERAYKRAIEKMLERRKERGLQQRYDSVEAVWRWWMEDDNLEGQLNIFDKEEPDD